MPWKDKKVKAAWDRQREASGERTPYYKRRWRKDKRRGNTPKKDLLRMYERFVSDMDPATDLRTIERLASEWYVDRAGATVPRVRSLKDQVAEAMAQRVMELFDEISASPEDGAIRIGERIVKAFFERTVRIPTKKGGYDMFQIVDAITGRVITQRKA